MVIVLLHVHNNKTIKNSTWTLFAMWSFFLCLTSGCSEYNGDNKRTKKSDDLFYALAEIQQMDSCRIKAKNREFYLHKYEAEKIITKYQDNSNLSNAEKRLITTAKSNMAFARTDYFMQVGKYEQAGKVMEELASNTTLNLYSDTTLWLNFLYHQGKVNYRPYNISTNKKTILHGYDCTVQGYILASRIDYPLYKALTLQVLSIYLLNDSIFSLAKKFDSASIRYVNEDNMPDSLLAGNLAERSLNIFLKIKDAYHTADAWRNLASCYFKIGDAQHSIECLNMAASIPQTDSMPDLLASINEQLSLSFAALDNKTGSDFYRNAYLDLQDSTRQDRELEARVTALQESTTKIWYLVGIAFTVFILLCLVTFVLTRIRKRKEKNATEEKEMLEQLQEELLTRRFLYSDELRSAVEQRARLSIITGMIPLIDRMKIAIQKGDFDYTTELADEIDRQNAMLTHWIKLRKGIIQPKIETFPLQNILDIINKNSAILSKQKIVLSIQRTTLDVKADPILTLFTINTLIDNARKAITGDGTITVSCIGHDDKKYAEISVSDTGRGMSNDQLDHLFEYKNIQNSSDSSSHGFGLVNCRGIIERYRKISSIFSVCEIHAKSSIGKGTTISFRLPLIVKAFAAIIFFCFNITDIKAEIKSNDSIAARYCDSLYKCNINGQYAQAMLYSDSCLSIVKRDSTIDIGIRLSLYNETAVAALALHQWEYYAYNNYLFTNLYKEYTADASLASYCQIMERNKQKANIAMLVVLLLIIALFPIFWYVYLRHLIKFRQGLKEKRQHLKEEIKKTTLEYEHLHIINNITDNQLSTLKHETMYYPVRIRQLAKTENSTVDLTTTINYYSELYNILCTQAISKQTSAFTFRIEKLNLYKIFSNSSIPDKHFQKRNDYIIILANQELMQYLKLLLKRHNGGKMPSYTVSKITEKYITLNFKMDTNRLLATTIDKLFSTSSPNVDFLIMRQIIRETGNASMCYGAGISAFMQNNNAIISITLPLAS